MEEARTEARQPGRADAEVLVSLVLVVGSHVNDVTTDFYIGPEGIHAVSI